MQVLRTPDDRFQGLKDYDFASNYLTLSGPDAIRMHYLDEGPASEGPVLCLHGEPTWSYLYRHMIPVFTAAGHRVIAPDLVGFGKSDKPVARADYSYQTHVDWLTDAVIQLDLREITLVCQDWGGLIGLRLWADMPDRVARVVVANTALPTGDHPMNDAFKSWRAYSQAAEPFNSGRIVHGGTINKLTDEEIAAYNAPFPDESHLAGARQFPMLVPDSPEDPAAEPNRQAWTVLHTLDTPVLTLFGAEDKVMAGVDRVFQKLPGAHGQPHALLPGAGHFLQEDVGPELARRTCDFIASTPVS
ncbi:haloalkane dehalogenase [Aliisedimentitalea scapharcae]|uniref:Haloalkane dehalogenase n=1 Tax=Aliisedimentitalea scapharcae TaxID=1524259 RepID=A0ABZ2XSJ1_9RHOB